MEIRNVIIHKDNNWKHSQAERKGDLREKWEGSKTFSDNIVREWFLVVVVVVKYPSCLVSLGLFGRKAQNGMPIKARTVKVCRNLNNVYANFSSLYQWTVKTKIDLRKTRNTVIPFPDYKFSVSLSNTSGNGDGGKKRSCKYVMKSVGNRQSAE